MFFCECSSNDPYCCYKKSFLTPPENQVLRLDKEGTQVGLPLCIGQDFVAVDTVHSRSERHFPKLVRRMSFGSLKNGSSERL